MAWQRAGLPPMPVAVNISAQQLRQRDLRTFPIRSIKIDRSFIRDLFTDTRDAAIVRALIALAHELGRARPRGQTSDELANPIWPL